MCKLAYASNLKKLNASKKQKLFNHVQKTLTQSDRSGYGIASKSLDGSIEIKRTLTVTDLITQDLSIPKFCKNSASGDFKASKANEVIFHARTSTNSISMDNTHPFKIGNTVLCHNGVLEYTGENYDKKTDNDTEDLTYHFDKFHLTNIDSVFSGYAAFIAFKNDSTYIVRDQTATLHYAYSKNLDCHFFGTTKSIVSEMLNVLGSNARVFEMEENHYVEIKNNKVIDVKKWSGLSYSRYASGKSHLSLGYSSNSVYGDFDSYQEWSLADRYGIKSKNDLTISKTEVSKNESEVKANALEYLGKFSDVLKAFFGSQADFAKALDAGEIIVKNKNHVISESDFWILDQDSKASLDIYWAC